MTQMFENRNIAVFALCLLTCATFVAPSLAVTLTPGSTTITNIANGDPVIIHGIATGHPQSGLQVWVIGKNYVKISNVRVNEDNTYSYELKSSDTRDLASGQYLVIIQHPMMNAEFDIVYDPVSGSVINRQLDSGEAIFQLTGPGSLQRPDAGYALMQAISSQNIDDTFTTVPFFVNAPVSLIDPIGNHYVGDTFTITGSTNLAVGDDLLVEIYSSSFGPTHKLQSGEFSGSTGTVRVVQGTNGYNSWSFFVDTSAFKPDEYLVKVSGVSLDVTASTTFTVTERTPVTTTPSSVTTLTLQPNTAQSTIPPALPPVTQSPLSVPSLIAGLAILGFARWVGRKS